MCKCVFPLTAHRLQSDALQKLLPDMLRLSEVTLQAAVPAYRAQPAAHSTAAMTVAYACEFLVAFAPSAPIASVCGVCMGYYY